MQSDALIRFEGPEDRAQYRRPLDRPGVEFYRARIRDHRFEDLQGHNLLPNL